MSRPDIANSCSPRKTCDEGRPGMVLHPWLHLCWTFWLMLLGGLATALETTCKNSDVPTLSECCFILWGKRIKLGYVLHNECPRTACVSTYEVQGQWWTTQLFCSQVGCPSKKKCYPHKDVHMHQTGVNTNTLAHQAYILVSVLQFSSGFILCLVNIFVCFVCNDHPSWSF